MQECRCVVSVGGDSIMIVQICVAINARRSSFARPYQIINLNQFGNKPIFFYAKTPFTIFSMSKLLTMSKVE